jgi:hypothetical protein
MIGEIGAGVAVQPSFCRDNPSVADMFVMNLHDAHFPYSTD